MPRPGSRSTRWRGADEAGSRAHPPIDSFEFPRRPGAAGFHFHLDHEGASVLLEREGLRDPAAPSLPDDLEAAFLPVAPEARKGAVRRRPAGLPGRDLLERETGRICDAHLVHCLLDPDPLWQPNPAPA